MLEAGGHLAEFQDTNVTEGPARVQRQQTNASSERTSTRGLSRASTSLERSNPLPRTRNSGQDVC